VTGLVEMRTGVDRLSVRTVGGFLASHAPLPNDMARSCSAQTGANPSEQATRGENNIYRDGGDACRLWPLTLW